MFKKVHVEGFSPPTRLGIQAVVCAILWLERLSTDVQLDIISLSTSSMCRVNHMSKGINAVTDVLTFHEKKETQHFVHSILFNSETVRLPGVDHNGPERISHQENSKGFPASGDDISLHVTEMFSADSKNKELWRLAGRYERSREATHHLGEIYICPSYMWWRCKRFPYSTLPFPLYMRAALVHAVLHALGYDHCNPNELRIMVKKEQKIGLQLSMISRRYPDAFPPLE